MAEIWGAAIAVAGTVYASEKQSSAAKHAANAQRDAANQAIDASEQNYQRTSTNLMPYIDAGRGALSGLNMLASGNYSALLNSPDYKFSLSQGLKGLDRSAAARGSLYSGGHDADVLGYAEGLASQQLGNYRNYLLGLAGMGQGAASNLGSVGTGNAATIGNYLTGAANAQGNAAYDQATAQGNMVGQLAGLAGQYFGQRGSGTASSYNLGGSGAQPYQGYNTGTLQNGTFDFTKASGGTY